MPGTFSILLPTVVPALTSQPGFFCGASTNLSMPFQAWVTGPFITVLRTSFRNMVITEFEIMAVLGCSHEPSGPQDVPRWPLYPAGLGDCPGNSPEQPVDGLLIAVFVSLAFSLLIISWVGCCASWCWGHCISNVPETMVIVIFLEEATWYCGNSMQCSAIQAWDSDSGSATY